MAARVRSEQHGGPNVPTPLFDRFESDRNAGLPELARDLANILGGRRATPGRAPGILNWGLPSFIGLSSISAEDRRRIAHAIVTAIEEYEPRLERVRVTPVMDSPGFSFRLDADLVQPEDRTVSLRILSPRTGGGLSAEVAVVGDARA